MTRYEVTREIIERQIIDADDEDQAVLLARQSEHGFTCDEVEYTAEEVEEDRT